jgi:glycosyltransferase involved in cell wall biosynthesis
MPGQLCGMRICYLAGSLGQGGAERQLFYFARTLAANGAQVNVLSLTDGEFWEQHLIDIGVQVERVGGNRPIWRRIMAIRRALRRFKPQILHSQHFFANAYLLPSCWGTGVTPVGSIRCDLKSELEGPLRWSRRLALKLTPVLVTNSRAALETAVRMGVARSRMRYLANVVDTQWFAPAPLAPTDELRIIAVGRLVDFKRFDRFLRIVAAVKLASPKTIRATIVGDGPLLSDLQAQARTLGLGEGDVRFIGAHTQVERLLPTADVLVLTSDFEGTPNVVLEAMACGLPVVASRVSGIPDAVPSCLQRFLVDPNDEAAFVEKLLELTEDPHLGRWLGQQARQHVLSRFDSRGLAHHLEEIYSDVLADPSLRASKQLPTSPERAVH